MKKEIKYSWKEANFEDKAKQTNMKNDRRNSINIKDQLICKYMMSFRIFQTHVRNQEEMQ